MSSSQYSLSSSTFDVRIDKKTGTISSLRQSGDEYGTNFVIGAGQRPEFDVEDSRFVGDLVLHVRNEAEAEGIRMTSGMSADIRTVYEAGNQVGVLYKGNAGRNGGFQGISLVEAYTLTGSVGDILEWSIEMTNDTSCTLDIEDLGLPLPMKSFWGSDQTENYEQSVHRHSFIAMHGSYIYWQRPNGEGDMLVMIPDRKTSLEFKQRFREGDGPYGENLPKWEGLAEFYVHSKNISRVKSKTARQYLPATSLTLEPGESQRYGFTFRWAAGLAGLRKAMYASGSIETITMPGMVLPRGLPGTVALRCQYDISSVTGDLDQNIEVEQLKSTTGYSIFQLRLSVLGVNYVTIKFDKNRLSVMQYYCIEPVEMAIKHHAAFLATNQLAKCPRGYNGAFLQWDMAAKKLLTWDNYPGGGWKEWMVGGSDDLGLAPAAYLSEQCAYFPDQTQIAALEYHIEHFLLGYLMSKRDKTGRRTFQVYRWYDGHDSTPIDTGIWRAYNYTHIANTFFNMYRISRAFPEVIMQYASREYLAFSFEVLNAMYAKIDLPNPIGDAANTLGLMGESTVVDIINALEAEGMVVEARVLQGFVKRKVDYYKTVRYPFASEQTIDTTGFESVYRLSETEGCFELVAKAQKASLACRGHQPLWYFYGSDNRMMGESYWNLGYETQLGAWQQQSYLQHHSSATEPDFADSMRSTYGAYLAGWANINSGQIDSDVANIGAASWLWQSEGGDASWDWMPLRGSWWAWSGEADLGFWAGLRTASVNVVQDPVVGLFAYGGTVTFEKQEYTISPADGVRSRLVLYCLNKLSISIEHASYTKAVIAADGSRIQLAIEQPTTPANAVVTISNAKAGNSDLTRGDSVPAPELAAVEGRAIKFLLPLTSAKVTIVIERRHGTPDSVTALN